MRTINGKSFRLNPERKKENTVLTFWRKYFSLQSKEFTSTVIASLMLFIASLAVLAIVYQKFTVEPVLLVSILVVLSILNLKCVGNLIISEFREYGFSYSRLMQAELVKDGYKFNLDQIKGVLHSKQDFVNLRLGERETNRVLVSRKLNRHLWDNPVAMKLVEHRIERVRNYIQKNRELICPFFVHARNGAQARGEHFADEEVLCMGEELGNSEVSCFKGSSYDGFLTNDISTSVLQGINNAYRNNASGMYPAKLNKSNGHTWWLSELGTNYMCNNVGVASLVITADNAVVVSFDNNDHVVSPLADGSCKWADVKNNNLTETIIAAIDREVRKSGIPTMPQKTGETKILGFYRDLSRGGKPMFVGLTKLLMTLEEVGCNRYGVANTLAFYMKELENLPALMEKMKKDRTLSFSMLMCLDAFEAYWKERPEELSNFLG